MDWRWTARRWFVSVFLAFQVSITVFWMLPSSPIKMRFFEPLSYYMLPLGLWQYWSMFAPDPPRDLITLEAHVVDNQGMRHNFAFPKLADYKGLQTLPRFRHPKFVANLMVDEFDWQRSLTARHVVRSLDLPDTAYPLSVQLYWVLRKLPEPGIGTEEAPGPPRAVTMKTVWFSTPNEVRP
jgi:hypothetical protein